jgi:Protein of unknown function (DUF2809)
MKLEVHKTFALLTIALIAVELYIAIFQHDNLLRYYGGDVLAPILLYALMKSFIRADSIILALIALIICCLFEIAQMFDMVTLLHLEDNLVMSTLIGTVYDVNDFLSYTAGTMSVICCSVVLRLLKRTRA